ncbi:hypothetical protein EF847_00380 [Actinobacteria bacterium YIM 96077]|uniref:Uncharacterized protein n=1 Tax=Phytoactinopolyspora halophila TaxID=1981511 RepID=A0A329R0G6_9ACTN|nr:hypothetical protein [Phytoactinopolyspora halophila]AYY11404.1 hypothetical protein EF847_00380 [Actinobacteria bacterium YIM 96077]RAW18114.1 hypothetical protein DPM12_04625 [Phytoactinopolyspora halophila]
MSSNFDVRALPLYRQIALFGGTLLFIALFFPWVRASTDLGGLGDVSASANGWNGIGVLVGVLVLLLVTWEALRIFGIAEQVKVKHDLVTAGLAGLTVLFGLIQFIRSLTYGPSGLQVSGISFGPHIGAFLIIILSVGLGYAAFMAFQAAGGSEALKEAQSQLKGDESRNPADSGETPPPPSASDTSGSDEESTR